ncbi:3879_t:CDS:2, partial [Diversispora eburnea]
MTEGIIISDSIIKEKGRHFAEEKVKVTVLFCSNLTGSHKFCPLVIGTSKKPQCFNGLNILQLPVTYKTSHIVLETIETWDDNIDNIDDEMLSENDSIDKMEELQEEFSYLETNLFPEAEREYLEALGILEPISQFHQTDIISSGCELLDDHYQVEIGKE